MNIISENWIETTLGEVATCRNGAGIKQEYFRPSGIPLVRVSDFTDDSIDIKNCFFLDPIEADKWKQHSLKQGDVVIATVGSWPPNWSSVVGKTIRVPKNAEGAIQNQNSCCVLAHREKADQRFLFYLLKGHKFVLYAANSAGGSANQARLPVGKLEKFCFDLPPLLIQRAIARILGSLDDKIELNRQMNETLEAMTRAIFQSWFVDFDPVRAKTDGRDTGLPAEIAALFPEGFEEVDGRKVPGGWGVGTISDLGDITSGKRPDNNEPLANPEKSIPIYGGGGVMGYGAIPLFHQPILLTGRVGTLGEIFRITYPCWASDNMLIVVAKLPESHEYLYYQLRSIDFHSLNRGSTQPLVTQKDLKAQEILLPAQEILREYHHVVKPLFEKIDKNDEQSRTLALIRDGLLPKLMSGEIRVEGIEI